jgi:Flp pilus assembly protein TadD
MGGAAQVSQEKERIQDAGALIEFKKGLGLLQKGYSLDAVTKLRHAASLEPHNAYFLSYLGLAVGVAQRKWAEAESLCLEALRIKRNLPQLYLNLAELYERSGRVAEAIEVLSEGLRFTGRDSRLTAALRSHGVRSGPVVPFLGRGNFLNRYFGRLRYKAKKNAQAK